jgi:hypothetical protein
MHVDPETGIRTFEPGDDAQYVTWVMQHDGYVLIEGRNGSYTLHDDRCSYLLLKTKNWSGSIDRPRRWAQAKNRLEEWAEGQTGSKPAGHRCAGTRPR